MSCSLNKSRLEWNNGMEVKLNQLRKGSCHSVTYNQMVSQRWKNTVTEFILMSTHNGRAILKDINRSGFEVRFGWTAALHPASEMQIEIRFFVLNSPAQDLRWGGRKQNWKHQGLQHSHTGPDTDGDNCHTGPGRLSFTDRQSKNRNSRCQPTWRESGLTRPTTTVTVNSSWQ